MERWGVVRVAEEVHAAEEVVMVLGEQVAAMAMERQEAAMASERWGVGTQEVVACVVVRLAVVGAAEEVHAAEEVVMVMEEQGVAMESEGWAAMMAVEKWAATMAEALTAQVTRVKGILGVAQADLVTEAVVYLVAW